MTQNNTAVLVDCANVDTEQYGRIFGGANVVQLSSKQTLRMELHCNLHHSDLLISEVHWWSKPQLATNNMQDYYQRVGPKQNCLAIQALAIEDSSLLDRAQGCMCPKFG